ncbi:MAG: hypothetical protein OEV28_00110 [Nitrospirota bacterium]|nr:hypothetical protein [Nitrospirota bacterium]
MLNLSTESIVIIVSFLVNLAVIAMLVLHVARDGKISRFEKQGKLDEEGLKSLVAHLEDLIIECERVSKDMCDRLSGKEADCKDLLRRMELKKEAIIAQYAGLRNRASLGNNDNMDMLFDEEVEISDAERVRTLAESGLSQAEIAHRLQIPAGEVKLMLSLQQQ